MIVKTFDTLTYKEKSIFFDKLMEVSEDKSSAATNMFGSGSNTLSHLLLNTDRFKKDGIYHIVFNNDKFVCCGGAYVSNFSNEVALLGVRTWVDREYRHNSITATTFLIEQKKWAIEKGCKILALSFNAYNKNLIKVFNRSRSGNANVYKQRKPGMLFYNNFNTLDFSVNIQNTEQWVCYERVGVGEFEWEQVKFL